jgi:hypothetical protein
VGEVEGECRGSVGVQVVEAFGSLLPIDGVIRGYPPGDVDRKVVGCKPIAAPGEGFTVGPW